MHESYAEWFEIVPSWMMESVSVMEMVAFDSGKWWSISFLASKSIHLTAG